jgi:hypothetical protein
MHDSYKTYRIMNSSGIYQKLTFCFALIVLCANQSWSQDFKAKEALRTGNGHYEAGEYEKALDAYRQASAFDTTYAKAAYNLANAMYQQGNIEEALGLYEEAGELFTNKTDKARSHHNIGRSYLQSGLSKIQAMAATGGQPSDQAQDPRPDLEAALSQFKEALILDPADQETRYNYSYTRKLLDKLPPSQDEQQQEQGDEGEEQENKEEKEDGSDKKNKKDQDENGQDAEKDQEEKNPDKQDEQEENQPDEQPEPAEASDPNRMNAERQLDLLDQEEKELQKQMSKKRMEGSNIKMDKDW